MITFEVFVLIIASIVGAFFAANAYIQHASTSYQSAHASLMQLRDRLENLIELEVPVGVARLGFMLSAAAGCGCFVRGIILTHYLPAPIARLVIGRPKSEPSPIEHEINAIEDLNKDQRKAFSALIRSVMIYDAFRNPLLGWMFHRIVESYAKPTYTNRAMTETTAVSVLMSRRTRNLSFNTLQTA